MMMELMFMIRFSVNGITKFCNSIERHDGRMKLTKGFETIGQFHVTIVCLTIRLFSLKPSKIKITMNIHDPFLMQNVININELLY